MAGQAFSFVQNIDAVGAWPPKRDSHVEMDGAWALYEAWLRLQMGDIDVALAMGSGRSSTADPALIYPMEMDPYYLAPLGTDARQLRRRCRRVRCSMRASVTERQMAEVAARTREDGKGRSYNQVTGDFDVDALLAEDYVRAPLRRHDLPPITDGACALVIARADKARELCDNPVWITGFRALQRAALPGHARPDDVARRRRSRPRPRASRKAPIEVAEIQSAFTHEEPLLVSALGLGSDTVGQPVGRPAAGEPDHGHRPGAHRRGRRADPRQRQAPHARALDVGSVPAAEPGLHPRRGTR